MNKMQNNMNCLNMFYKILGRNMFHDMKYIKFDDEMNCGYEYD